MKNLCSLYAILLLFLGVSCTDDPEVLEFDESYTPQSPTKGNRDTPPPVDLLTVYAYFQETGKDIVVNRTPQADGTLKINGDIADVELQVKTTIPVEEATTFEVVPMEMTDEEYPKIIKGLINVLPQSSYTIEDAVLDFTIGTKELPTTTKLKFNKEAFLELDKTKQYALPLKVKVTTGTAEIVNHFVLNVSLQDVEAIPQAPNVSLKSDATTPEEDKVIKEGALVMSSNYAAGHVGKLNDGELYYNNWWVNEASENYLTVNFDDLKKVKAIIIYGQWSWSGTKNIKSVNIEVSQDGGNSYVEQGEINFPDARVHYIEFTNAVSINQLRFSGFKAYSSDGYTNLAEIQLVME